MKYCSQCGSTLNETTKYCPTCGVPVTPQTAISKIKTCPNCGNQFNGDAHFCENCGSPYDSRNAESLNGIHARRSLDCFSSSGDPNIIEYLRRVTDLERSTYTQMLTIFELQNYVDDLGHPNEYTKPRLPGEYSGNLLKGMWTAVTSGTLVVGLLIWFFSKLAFLPSMFLGGFLSCMIVLIFNLIEANSVNKERQSQYEYELSCYNSNLENDEKRVKEEIVEKLELISVIEDMQEKCDETSYVLEQYYAKNIIFPKYRNLFAMSSIYEYFLSGRCKSLSGAYNKYEEEARLEKICTKLDEVTEKLDQIKENQYYLYDAIQEGNRTSQRLLEESVKQSRLAEHTAENTALAAHYAEISANNTEACAWIGIANYISIQENNR